MKKIIILLLMLTLTMGVLQAESKKAAPKKAPKPTVGKVISLSEVGTGNFTTWTKQTADDAAAKGTPFVLMVGEGKKAAIYFVYNEDGSFAGKKLAKYAFNKKVGIVGKVQTKFGLKVLVAEMIESMD